MKDLNLEFRITLSAWPRKLTTFKVKLLYVTIILSEINFRITSRHCRQLPFEIKYKKYLVSSAYLYFS